MAVFKGIKLLSGCLRFHQPWIKVKQVRRTAMDRSKRLQLKEESTYYLRFLQVLTPTIQRSIAAQRPLFVKNTITVDRK